MMNRVIKILMDRDDLTEQEAKERVNEVRDMMYECMESGDSFGAEEILMDELMLEPDYIFDILGY